jgi:gamma-glutamyl-gamma-aminobutyraldehyde dehydrogenase
VANARQAFDDGRWRNLSSGERGAVFNKLADLIDSHRETLALSESKVVQLSIFLFGICLVFR